ncbi:hypothetical protein E2C11_13500 [Streptomyces lavendulae]|nr:hypothetical protein [Streptomyces lavendulae]TXJ79222.1 hypothetical protein E2C11_13500 [Streptomyces lavendulae]
MKLITERFDAREWPDERSEELFGGGFPEPGGYVIPRGPGPLRVDRDRDQGVYGEPHVWMRHL